MRMIRLIAFAIAVVAVLLLAGPAAIASPGATERVSVDTAGSEGAGPSEAPCISSDGRYVAFVSYASNLVDEDTNGKNDIFVHDRQTGVTERISVDSAGNQANDWSDMSSDGQCYGTISADGRYVAFRSAASNLVPGDTAGRVDVFVHDRQTGATERVTVDSSGNQQTNGDSRRYSISSDGRYVAFDSSASDLVLGDTNNTEDIFVHDRQTGVTERVSVDSSGNEGNGASRAPSISADGRFVAWDSEASNLASDDTNGQKDIFVHDGQTGTTERVDVDSAGNQSNGYSAQARLSADGRYVLFESWATNLVPNDTVICDFTPGDCPDQFVHDRQTGTTEMASVDSAGNPANGWSNMLGDLSSDGRFVAFRSSGDNLVPGDTNNANDVFIRDRQLDVTVRVSVNSAGNQANGDSYYVSMTADGRYIAFTSWASNLVSGDTNGDRDVFVHDRGEELPARITIDSTADANARDGVLTLREGVLLATGALAVGDLDAEEADNVNGTPGAASADTIVFDIAVFPPATPATINLSSGLPSLSTGNDTIDGSEAGVILDGQGAYIFPVEISSDGNRVKGLEIYNTRYACLRIRDGAQGNTVGGTTPQERNILSSGQASGPSIDILGPGTSYNVVIGNYMGTNRDGTGAIGGGDAVLLWGGAQHNTIGGTTPEERNVISGNFLSGVMIRHSDTDYNRIIGNLIGTDVSGTVPLPNGQSGVYLEMGAQHNIIGGPGQGNVIAFNGWDGVTVDGEFFPEPAPISNTITANSIHSNGGKGIENINGGNVELAAPIIDSVGGSVSGHTAPKCYPCTVEIFSDDEDEGRIYHGSTTTNDDATGTWAYAGAVTGPNITATVTDADGNTSEFSGPVSGGPDADGDGVPDGTDLCAGTAPGALVDASGCSDAQVDPDEDGICNPGAPSGGPSGCVAADSCPFEAEDYDGHEMDGCPDADNDADTIADVCVDQDWDGLCDPGPITGVDGDPITPSQLYMSAPDGMPTPLWPAILDNCRDTANPDQSDVDGDRIGDLCDSTNDPDRDDDGIVNAIDGEVVGGHFRDNSAFVSDSFTDAHLPLGGPTYGRTFGRIVNRADLSVQVSDLLPNTEPDQAGVRIEASGGTGTAQVSVCGLTTLSLTSGAAVNVACGSVTIEVVAGPVTASFGSFVASLPQDTTATIAQSAPGAFEITNSPGSSAPITVNGMQIPPGGTERDEDGDSFFTSIEQYLGTDSLDACPDVIGTDDAWPLDINMNKVITVVGDVLPYSGRIGATGGPPASSNWWQRLDLDKNNYLTVVGDVLKFSGKIGQTCT